MLIMVFVCTILILLAYIVIHLVCQPDHFQVRIFFDKSLEKRSRIYSKGNNSLCFFPTNVEHHPDIKPINGSTAITTFRIPFKHCGSIKVNKGTYKNTIFVEDSEKGVNTSHHILCNYKDRVLMPKVSNVSKIKVTSTNTAKLKSKCNPQNIQIDLIFDKPFDGQLYTTSASPSNKRKCLYQGIGSKNLTFTVPYDDCGTILKGKDYVNRIIIELPNEYKGKAGFEIHLFRCQKLNITTDLLRSIPTADLTTLNASTFDITEQMTTLLSTYPPKTTTLITDITITPRPSPWRKFSSNYNVFISFGANSAFAKPNKV
ncbi:unnamed protein product [Gordionus sp. m RMFG-2023]